MSILVSDMMFLLLLMVAVFYFGAAARADKHHGARHSASVASVERWHRIQTVNFQIFFKCSPNIAQQVSEWCEEAKTEIEEKWLDAASEKPWSPQCEIILFNNPKEYALSTGYDPASVGASQLEIGNGTVSFRRINARVDDTKQLFVVLRHELTHIILADRFSTVPIPRWADEGIAINEEGGKRASTISGTIERASRTQGLFSVRSLLTAKVYPESREAMTLFYAQSASLVQYLARKRSSHEFLDFVHGAEAVGYDRALAIHFAIDGIDALEREWRSDQGSTMTPRIPLLSLSSAQ